MGHRTVRVSAPAKVNLTLHVTGKRQDGYHELDTLVVFAPVCDRLVVEDGNNLSLMVDGPEADGVPADMMNLALRAAAIHAGEAGAAIALEKHLPARSGIGGGSADAAAAIRAMMIREESIHQDDWQMPADPDQFRFAEQIRALGADVPMCLLSRTCRARGIGEKLEFLDLPPLPALLVNPRVAVATPDVFGALVSPDNPPMPEKLPGFADAEALSAWLAGQRNDLEVAAIGVAPVIAEVLEVLRRNPACRLARMSGSGATCFAIYADSEAATAAAEAIRSDHPDWWLASGVLGDQSALAKPEFS